MTEQSSKGRKLIVGALAIPVVTAVVALFAMLMGAAAGWAGELIFPQVFHRLSDLIFGETVPGWQIGAMLGFVGAFLRLALPGRR